MVRFYLPEALEWEIISHKLSIEERKLKVGRTNHSGNEIISLHKFQEKMRNDVLVSNSFLELGIFRFTNLILSSQFTLMFMLTLYI